MEADYSFMFVNFVDLIWFDCFVFSFIEVE